MIKELGGKKFEFHDDAKVIEISRLNVFKKYMRLHQGLTPDSFNKFDSFVGTILGHINEVDKENLQKKKDYIIQELYNLRIYYWQNVNNLTHLLKAAAALIKSVDDKPFNDYRSDSRIDDMADLLQQCDTQKGELEDIIEHSKKKSILN